MEIIENRMNGSTKANSDRASASFKRNNPFNRNNTLVDIAF